MEMTIADKQFKLMECLNGRLNPKEFQWRSLQKLCKLCKLSPMQAISVIAMNSATVKVKFSKTGELFVGTK
jgi:hypothetical protein